MTEHGFARTGRRRYISRGLTSPVPSACIPRCVCYVHNDECCKDCFPQHVFCYMLSQVNEAMLLLFIGHTVVPMMTIQRQNRSNVLVFAVSQLYLFDM